ncbi:MAG: glycosyltransferase [Planctomycetes bacterium]|nr:glycosyltransferase [Planctomycetota bacterium]
MGDGVRGANVSVEKDRRSRVAVAMPAYNELWTIREIFRRVTASDVVDELVIVDDASTDGTWEVLQEVVGAYSGRVRVRLLRQPRNRGKGAALRRAFAEVTAPLTIVQDADLEYDPADYAKLIAPILEGQADVVYGSRFSGYPRRVLRFWHEMANRVLTTLSNVATNLNLTDMETGYKAFKTAILKGLSLRSDRFGFEPEITAKVARLGCRVYEVPVAYHGRSGYEGKKIGFWDGVEALWVIFKFWLIDDLGPVDVESYTLKVMQRATAYNRWLFEKIRAHVRGRVLEVGSGLGNITRFLAHCPEVTATDIEPRFLEELETVFAGWGNITVRRFDVEQGAKDLGRFDAIVALNVVEHVRDHEKALANVAELLRPGGRVVMLVPAHPSLHCGLDRHLGHHRRYTREGVEALLRGAGLSVVESRYLNKLGAIGWFVNGRVMGRRVLPSSQMRLFSRIVPLLDAVDALPMSFGLSVLVVGERQG